MNVAGSKVFHKVDHQYCSHYEQKDTILKPLQEKYYVAV